MRNNTDKPLPLRVKNFAVIDYLQPKKLNILPIFIFANIF